LLAAASDKAYQLLAHDRWFFPGTPASSTTKTGRHDIAEILLKMALNTINQIKSIFDIWILITPLVSSNSSSNYIFYQKEDLQNKTRSLYYI
jgi:hypothetical protein